MLNKHEVLGFLQYPDAELVEFSLKIANLTWKESIAVDLCGRKQYTQEAAAEKIGCSVDALQRWYSSGMKKLCNAWEMRGWVEKIIS